MSDAITRLNAALSGRYTVEREVGEGGMATVYLADDLKHERKVALKVLKPELAAVVGAERFLAEIKTTAQLQHPHILPLHDSGEADGFLFYVMPYIEGETLGDRIARDKQLPVDEAVGIAVAIANALQTAHDQGIVHRDIKPGNILMSRGQPLVADFGIALAVGVAGGNRLTETGLSVGTPFYMSPEQATGDQALGPASDTYALAAVLCEMLTGDPPYLGSTAQAVLGQILTGDPVSLKKKRSSIPANVDAAVRKALERLPADRFGRSDDFGKALGDPGFRYGEKAETGAASASAGAWKLASAALGATTMALAALLTWSSSRPDLPEPISQFLSPFREGQHPTNFGLNAFSLAPDGSFLVYRGPGGGQSDWQLWMRRWDDLEATPIRGTEVGTQPAISPDGRRLAFFRGGDIQIVDVEGGPVRTLIPGQWPRWTEDGSTIYFATGGGALVIPAAGGQSEPVPWTSDGEIVEATWVSMELPNRRFAIGHTGGPGALESWVVDLDSGEAERLAQGGFPHYTETGHLLFLANDGSLIAAPFDPESLETTGPSVPLRENVAQFSLSRTGDLVYTTTLADAGGDLQDTELVWVTRSGGTSPVQEGLQFDRGGGNYVWELSPDDTRLALRRRTGGNSDIWIKELPDGALRRLTFDEGEQRAPWWSPDGNTVYYLSGPFGQRHVWESNADGTGQPRPVWEEGSYAEGLWSPDGEWLVLRTAGLTGGSEGDRAIVALQQGGDEATTTLIETEYVEQSPTLSPDGRWMAYESDESGRREVYVRPFPDVEGGKWQVSTAGGIAPLWSHGGSELYFVLEGDMMVATIEVEPTFSVTGVEELFELPSGALIGSGTGSYDVTLDDQRFVMALDLQTQAASGETPDMVLVQNFFEELKARVPN